MYKLILDRSRLSMYSDFYPESNVESISQDFYNFLRGLSRTTESPIFVFGKSLIPVKMLVSIRTDRTNELIVPDSGKFYIECPTEYPSEHPLDDLVLLAAKNAVDKYFDCGEDIIRVIPRTIPLPVGAFLRDNAIYVYVTLVVDHTLKTEEFFKLKDCHYESITSLSPTSPLETELLNNLALVKGDNTDA